MKYHMPTRIYYGPGMMSQISRIVKEDLGKRRIYLITDQGLRRAGVVEKLIGVLPVIEVFDEVEPNPRHTTVDRAGERVRELQPNLVIGLGGGSVLDAAKAIALLASNPGCIEDYEGRARYQQPPLPLLAVPTTCGTGSEVTWVAVITHTGRKFKMSIKGPEMYPAAAVVDPDLLESLPASLVASTGMDALVHAVEAYTVKPASFLTDLLAEQAVCLIGSSLLEAFADIKNHRSARDQLMRGSLTAGMAFGNSDVGAVHCISESIGAMFDIPHGVANAIFLPYVLGYNLPAAPEKFAAIAAMLGIDSRDQNEAGRLLIKKIHEMSKTLGIPAFSELGIGEEHFAEIAQKSYENNSNPSNVREAGVDDYLGIIKQAAGD